MLRLLVLLALAAPVAAQPAPGPYHQGLAATLAGGYGIEDARWLLPPTEAATRDTLETLGWQRGLRGHDLVIEGQPFTLVRELSVPADSFFLPFETAYRGTLTESVAEDEAVLLTFWLRCLEAEGGACLATAVLEETAAPFDKALRQDVPLAPEDGWRQVWLPILAPRAYAADHAQFKLFLGYQEQTLQVGGVAALAVPSEAEALPTSPWIYDYAGRADGAAWREAAHARIDALRRGRLAVRVVDSTGVPVEGADVRVVMRRHAFGFGAAVRSEYFGPDAPPEAVRYRETFQHLGGEGRGLTLATIENGLKWPIWETHPERRADTRATLDTLQAWGVGVRGHTLVWPRPESLPDDVANRLDEPDYVWQRIVAGSLQGIAGDAAVQGRIAEWDVLNESVHHPGLAETFGTEAVYADLFAAAAEVDPQARLVLNDYDVLRSAGLHVKMQDEVLRLAAGLQEADVPFDGVGLQSHMRSVVTPPARLLEVLDRFEDVGLSVRITEYDTQGSITDDLAADHLADALTAAFSHPAMTAFVLWGFWDGAHPRDDAPLFYEDWTPKPALAAYRALVFDRWWTDDAGTTDAAGLFATDAFFGKHQVTVTLDGASAEIDTLHFAAPDTVEVVLDATGVSVEAPSTGDVRLLAPRPNPASGAVRLAFEAPTPQRVRLALYDVLGREVVVLHDGLASAGTHEARLTTESLPAGLYLVRLATGGGSQTQRFVVAR